jgi:hypothetical protein
MFLRLTPLYSAFPKLRIASWPPTPLVQVRYYFLRRIDNRVPVTGLPYSGPIDEGRTAAAVPGKEPGLVAWFSPLSTANHKYLPRFGFSLLG